MSDNENLLIRPLGSKIVLRCVLSENVPSFKNHKHSNRSGFVYTNGKVKKRMQELENAILSELYSLCQTSGSGTHSECLKQLRIALSGLSDDSIKEVPSGSWDVEYVKHGEQGVRIEIESL